MAIEQERVSIFVRMMIYKICKMALEQDLIEHRLQDPPSTFSRPPTTQ